MNIAAIAMSAMLFTTTVNVNSNVIALSNIPTHYIAPAEFGVPTNYVPPKYVSINIATPLSAEPIELVYLDVKLSKELQEHIYNEWDRLNCKKYLSKEEFLSIITAIIQWESGFDASNSNGKCHGLMSIMTLSENTMMAWGIEDLLDPYDNITAGIHCFLNGCDWALENYGSEQMIEHALLRYNLGEHEAEKYLSNHDAYNRTYVQNVMGSMNKYMGELNG